MANSWILVQKDGKWYASTFEWMPKNNKCKQTLAIAGDHIKKFNVIPSTWKPSSGEKLGFFVSTLIRNGKDWKNAPGDKQERTNVVFIDWP